MKLSEIKQQLIDCREDFYENDKKDCYEALEIREYFEKDDEDNIDSEDMYDDAWSISDIIVAKANDENELYWVKIKKDDFDKWMRQAKNKSSFKFFYTQGNNSYGDSLELKIVSVNDCYIYFEPIA